jgi:hypothetical protein
MFFREPHAQNDQPGWFCACGYQILARTTKLPIKARRRAIVARRAKVRRKSMIIRARAVRLPRDRERIRETRRSGKK